MYSVMSYFYQFLVLNWLSKMWEKESLECGRMHIWALKTQKLLGPLSGPWTPAANGSLHSYDSTLLHWQLLALEASPPPAKSCIRTWKIFQMILQKLYYWYELKHIFGRKEFKFHIHTCNVRKLLT